MDPTDETAKRKRIEFLIGFGGWFAVNALLYAFSRIVFPQFGSAGSLVFWFLVFVINIGGLVILAIRRKQVASGAVVALAMAFGVGCIAGIVVLVTTLQSLQSLRGCGPGP